MEGLTLRRGRSVKGGRGKATSELLPSSGTNVPFSSSISPPVPLISLQSAGRFEDFLVYLQTWP